MSRGRPKVPAHVKSLRGTLRRGRDGIAQGTTLPVGRVELPAPPDWLVDPVAVAEWHRAGSILAMLHALPESSHSALGHYCMAHAQLVASYQRGVATDPAILGQLRLLASSLHLIGARALPTPVPPSNPFSKFKRHSEGGCD